MLLEFSPRTYTAGPFFCVEDVRSLGPQNLTTVGDGTYNTLFGASWRLIWDKKRGLILLQKQGLFWSEMVPDAPLPELPKQARKIGLAFDQVARPVISYQVGETIYVRQWIPQAAAYQYQTVVGVDPLILMDAHAHFYVPDSDVLLYYLDPARTTLYRALQRESYQDAVQKAILPEVLYLDQVVTVPYFAQVATHNRNGLKRYLLSPVYPFRAEDRLSLSGGVSTGLWDTVGYSFDAADSMALSGGVSTGLWDIANVTLTISESMAFGGSIQTGVFDEMQITLNAAESLTLGGSIQTGVFDPTAGSNFTASDAITLGGGIVGGTWT